MLSLILSVLLQALVLLLILSCDIPVVLDTIRWCRQQSCVLTLLLAPSYCYYCYYYHNLCVYCYIIYILIFILYSVYTQKYFQSCSEAKDSKYITRLCFMLHFCASSHLWKSFYLCVSSFSGTVFSTAVFQGQRLSFTSGKTVIFNVHIFNKRWQIK